MTVDEQGKVLFREEQRFRQWWILALVLLVAALGWWAFVEQILLGRPWGSKPGPDWVVWLVFVLFGVGLPLLFLMARLVVVVRPHALEVSYVPFRRKRFGPGDVEGAEAVTFRPILDWGGWGIRWSKGKGWAYTVAGNTGVRLDLAGGKHLTIGSQKPHDLLAAVLSQLVSDTGRDGS